MGLIDDIEEIPARAKECLASNMGLHLPAHVPYVGMGSSYFAPLTLRYCGIDIEPQIASEYYGYLSSGRRPAGVLLSQSGQSSETVWCRDLFDEYTAIVNDSKSKLARDRRAKQVVELHAGDETFSSTKTYVNTLVTLFVGHGIDATVAVDRLSHSFEDWRVVAEEQAQDIAKYFRSRVPTGLYVVGSGPNVGTAGQAALVLSETSKRSWTSMTVAQYDHGPKETAENSVVILLDARGREAKRIAAVRSTLQAKSNALIVDITENAVGETLSAIPLITRINLLMNALATRLGVGTTFAVGDKVTIAGDETRPH